jgi:hypothetical protein
MRVSEEPVCIDLFWQNPVFTSLHLRSPVHVVPPQITEPVQYVLPLIEVQDWKQIRHFKKNISYRNFLANLLNRFLR